MLMSLTMRLCPTPPEDSRGVTSVVAIPTPSFSSRATFCARNLGSAKEETFHYKGGCVARRAKSRACGRRGTYFGTCWGRRNWLRRLRLRSYRTGRCCGTYYIVTRAIQQGEA